MKNNNYLWTSESVSKGHPDKVADQISDAILDAILRVDSDAKVGCEVLGTGNFIIVAGEVKYRGHIDVDAIVRKTVIDIGCDNDDLGFNGHTCEILNKIQEQSPEINQAVVKEDGSVGAGDQGIMFGYASNETPELMPLTISLAHGIIRSLETVRFDKLLDFLRPDAKSQVTVEYDENDKAVRIDTIVVSTQHSPDVTQTDLQRFVKIIIENYIKSLPVEISNLLKEDTKYIINPSGSFVRGIFWGDTGLTGRKLTADDYGADCQIGGGAKSGKDNSKVDRSASYIARYVAKNIVANGYADKAKVQLSYAIGIAKPISVRIQRYGEDKRNVTDIELIELVNENFDLTPAGIINKLGLKNPIFLPTASGGHFGRTPYIKDGLEFFTWEKTDVKF
jgi:S-adenosylmethionine synthetase